MECHCLINAAIDPVINLSLMPLPIQIEADDQNQMRADEDSRQLRV